MNKSPASNFDGLFHMPASCQISVKQSQYVIRWTANRTSKAAMNGW